MFPGPFHDDTQVTYRRPQLKTRLRGDISLRFQWFSVYFNDNSFSSIARLVFVEEFQCRRRQLIHNTFRTSLVVVNQVSETLSWVLTGRLIELHAVVLDQRLSGIHGLYELGDVAHLPSQFPAEFPRSHAGSIG